MAFNIIGISNLVGLCSEYSHIKSGAYKNLLNTYYSKVQGNEKLSHEDISSLVSGKYNFGDEKDPLKNVKANSDSLGVSSLNLMDKSADSVFSKKKVEKLDEESGEKFISDEYDVKGIKNAVSQFVSDYNAVIEHSANTDSTKVMKKTLDMIDNTKIYKDNLEKIGISIGSDNKLSIDEEKFEAANMDSVKSLFNKENSLGQRTMQKALQISNEAYKEQLGLSLYNNKGSYDSNDYYSLLNMYL